MLGRRGGLRILPAKQPGDPLATLADKPVSDQLDGGSGVLPDGADGPRNRQPGPAHPGGSEAIPVHDTESCSRCHEQCGQSRFLHDDTLGVVGRHQFRPGRHEHHDSGLHAVGRDPLCRRGYGDHASDRPPPRCLVVRAAEARGGFPLFPRACPRERRGNRPLRRRGGRARPAWRQLWPSLRQLVPDHADEKAPALVQFFLQPACRAVPLRYGGASILFRRHNARHLDADLECLRPGAVQSLLVHHQLSRYRRLEGHRRPTDRLRPGHGRRSGRRRPWSRHCRRAGSRA